MKFAYSTNAFTEFPLSVALFEIARCGFEGAEILADIPHLNPLRSPPQKVRKVAHLLARLGLAVSNVNVNTNRALSNEDPEGFRPCLLDRSSAARYRRIAYISRALQATHQLGGANAAVSVGRAPKGESRRPALERLVESMKVVMHHAEESGVRVGVEYEPGHFIERSDQLLELIDRVQHPMLGANLDVGHAVCAGEDPGEVVRRLSGRIWNLHLEDIKGGVHQHLVPGQGDIDFRSLFRALKETRYDGFLTLELYPYKENPTWAGREGLRHLQGLL
jgi:sugar phosphate isomerase/epimerase